MYRALGNAPNAGDTGTPCNSADQKVSNAFSAEVTIHIMKLTQLNVLMSTQHALTVTDRTNRMTINALNILNKEK